MAADPTSVPQSYWNAIGGVIGGILALLYASLGWSYIRQVNKNDAYAKKVDDLELRATGFAIAADVAKDYVQRKEFKDMEVRVAGLTSRRELIVYLRAAKEEQQRQHNEQQRQHSENKDGMRELRDASLLRDRHAQEFRQEMRDKFEDLALKVQAVATTQQVQSDQKRS